MSLLEKIFLVVGVSVILFPFVVFTTAMVVDAIHSYLDDRWINEGEKERKTK